MLPTLGVQPPPKIDRANELTSRALDSTGCVVATVLCVKCGYDVRMQQGAGKCPECGEPIATSLRSSWLFFSKPGRVRIVCAGLWVLIASWLIGAISLAVSLIPWFSASFMFQIGWWTQALFGTQMITSLVYLAGNVLVTWRVTQNESTRTIVLRWSVRAVAGLTCLLLVSSYLLWYLMLASPSFTVDNTWIREWFFALVIAGQFASCGNKGLLLWYERVLASHIPSRRLMRWILLVFVAAMIGHGINLAITLLPMTGAFGGLNTILFAVYIPWVIAFILELTVPIALLRTLKPVLRRAKANWQLAG